MDSTLNLHVGELSSVFGKADMATGLLERLIDHRQLLVTTKES
jgi:hypothetical protein